MKGKYIYELLLHQGMKSTSYGVFENIEGAERARTIVIEEDFEGEAPLQEENLFTVHNGFEILRRKIQ